VGTGSRAASPRRAMLPRGRSWPPPVRPRLPAGLLYRIQRVLAPNAFTAAEKTVKDGIFGCRMCGQCALPVTGYACPMTCPKQLRNGPCGGVGSDGSCEVYPDLRCVWLVAFERAEAAGRAADLDLLQRPIDHRAWGQSSWVNYWSGRDDDLWATGAGPAAGRR
jgi:Methylene-tetrahydrofolate reductase C terminal